MKLFSVHDIKAQTYLNPNVFRSSAEALRAFETTVKQPDTQFHMYPNDFSLVELGSWDSDSGLIQPYTSPKHLIVASELLSSI